MAQLTDAQYWGLSDKSYLDGSLTIVKIGELSKDVKTITLEDKSE